MRGSAAVCFRIGFADRITAPSYQYGNRIITAEASIYRQVNNEYEYGTATGTSVVPNCCKMMWKR